MSQTQIPQATSPLAMWLDYLTNIHTSAIDLGLDRVQAVAEKTNLVKPAPTVITVAGPMEKVPLVHLWKPYCLMQVTPLVFTVLPT